VSIGTAVFDPRSVEDVQSVFRRADLALYAAKRAGRNRVVMHTPECEEMLASADSSVRPSSTLARAEEAGR
jgi:predicted signal transduction protein with EAL and GGDEF domain